MSSPLPSLYGDSLTSAPKPPAAADARIRPWALRQEDGRRASDERGGYGDGGRRLFRAACHPIGVVLRSGLCLRPYPGNRLPRRSPDVGGDVAGRRAARDVVVGVGGIFVVDERRAR